MPRTLIVTQCCKRKSEVELFPGAPEVDLPALLPETGDLLRAGRRSVLGGLTGSTVTALSLYDGWEYRAMDKRLIYKAIMGGVIELLIISGGYGVVHPLERVRPYEAQMTPALAKKWLEIGLPKVLEEFVAVSGVERVYGLFTASSQYSKIFRDVNWTSLKSAGVELVKLVRPVRCAYASKSLEALGLAVNALASGRGLPSPRDVGCRWRIERL